MMMKEGDFACVTSLFPWFERKKVHSLLFKQPTLCDVFSSPEWICDFIYVPRILVANNMAGNIFVQFYFTSKFSISRTDFNLFSYYYLMISSPYLIFRGNRSKNTFRNILVSIKGSLSWKTLKFKVGCCYGDVTRHQYHFVTRGVEGIKKAKKFCDSMRMTPYKLGQYMSHSNNEWPPLKHSWGFENPLLLLTRKTMSRRKF